MNKERTREGSKSKGREHGEKDENDIKNYTTRIRMNE